MPTRYNFSYKRRDSGGYSGSPTAQNRYTQYWQCILDDDGQAGDPHDPTLINWQDVMQQGWLPKVNETLWTDGTEIDPFAVCSGVSIDRHDKQLNLYTGTVEYSSYPFTGVSSQYLAPVPIAAAITDYPSVWQPRWDKHEEVLYEDLDTTSPKLCRTPNETYFTEPFIHQMPVESYVVVQLEQTLTLNDYFLRSYSASSAEYTGPRGPGSIPAGHWKIDRVTEHTVEAVIDSANPTPTKAKLVTYEVARHPIRTWHDERVLWDSVYRETPGGPIKPYTDETGTAFRSGLIKADGTKVTDGVPVYETYYTRDQVDFNTFLRDAVNAGQF
jgi:hypothetical protein